MVTLAKVLKFSEGQKQLLGSLKQNFKDENFGNFEKTFDSLVSHDTENKKLVLDQIFREFLTRNLLPPSASPDIAACQRFIVQFAIQAARKGFCSPGTPIQVLSDMFDILTLAHCETLFKTVEQEVTTWREQVFFASCKNNLLRICNDLLRRLSRTQNTVFCGRILLFLAKFFPFSERSGLNVISEFNLDNTTNFNKEEDDEKDEKDEKSDLKIKIDADEHNLNVDYSLYCKFWQIQDYFRNPVQCYQKVPWKTFSSYASDVLSTFQSFKLDPNSGRSASVSSSTPSTADQYFAKYLTNQNLLQLQLSDSNFRRYILLQFLILFQYLKSNVKFKTDAQTLESSQTKWIEETKGKIFKLLAETPPNGSEFSKSVKHILHREEHWNKWKNEGCPSFAKKVEENAGEKRPIGEGGSYRRKKRKLGDLIQKEIAEKKVNLGNSGLTALWNLHPDNLEACRAKDRDFLPSLENYFEEAIEQLDPRNEIEEAYKKVNNGEWGWRALRLMSRRSSHFFISGNNPIAKLPEYLESMLGKMAKEMPGLGAKEETEVGMSADVGDAIAENGEEGEVKETGRVTDAQLVDLSFKLADDWKKLAPKLGIADDKLTEISENDDSDGDKCLALLKAWVEVEGPGATQEEIVYILEGLKLASDIEGVFA
eukprot:TRINITY_DN2230_c0_g1_i1.p1 TRINITY_DN2230_c0_g1~~TRINITY_DN2230_c0_g1_i1.p1  ORF type:complete len:654 (-),score=223.35 TRINITY_DN2230_c0_g1_i1:66-2027(-)